MRRWRATWTNVRTPPGGQSGHSKKWSLVVFDVIVMNLPVSSKYTWPPQVARSHCLLIVSCLLSPGCNLKTRDNQETIAPGDPWLWPLDCPQYQAAGRDCAYTCCPSTLYSYNLTDFRVRSECVPHVCGPAMPACLPTYLSACLHACASGQGPIH